MARGAGWGQHGATTLLPALLPSIGLPPTPLPACSSSCAYPYPSGACPTRTPTPTRSHTGAIGKDKAAAACTHSAAL